MAHLQSRGQDAGFVASTTLAFLSTVTSGSLLIAGTRVGGITTTLAVSDDVNGAWTRTREQDTVDDHSLFVDHFLNSGSGTVTVTCDPSGTPYVRWIIGEYSQIATSGALDQVNSATGNSTSLASGNITTLQADETLICVGSVQADASFTPDADFTERQEIVLRVALEDRIVSATGTYQGTWSVSASSQWCCILASFKHAAAGGRTTKNTRAWPLGVEIGMGWQLPV